MQVSTSQICPQFQIAVFFVILNTSQFDASGEYRSPRKIFMFKIKFYFLYTFLRDVNMRLLTFWNDFHTSAAVSSLWVDVFIAHRKGAPIPQYFICIMQISLKIVVKTRTAFIF